MFLTMKVIFALLYFQVFFGENSCCPFSSVIKPCVCSIKTVSGEKKMDIKCQGQSITDQVFNQISEAIRNSQQCQENASQTEDCNFDELQLIGTAISSINLNNSFVPLRSIVIRKSVHLRRLNPSAFGDSEQNLENLEIHSSAQINMDDIISFAINFGNLKRLTLKIGGLTKIHKEMFTEEFKKLEELDLSRNNIAIIEDSSFIKLTKLRKLKLSNNNIRQITKNTFRFEPPAPEDVDTKLYLSLDGNYINSYSTDPGSFSSIYRPVHLDLSSNLISEVSAAIFGSFLFADYRNVVIVAGNPIVCDESSSWILRNVKYMNYTMGGEDPDVNKDFVFHKVGGKNIATRRQPNDYSFYKIQGMICPDGKNIFQKQ